MRYLAYLAIAAFFSISALVSVWKPWFGFIYDLLGGDKFAHFVGPGLLSFLMVLGFSSLAKQGRLRGPLISLVATSVLVTLDEVIQLAIPSRSFDLKDLAWSLTGVLVFGLAATGIEWFRHLRYSGRKMEPVATVPSTHNTQEDPCQPRRRID
jgi:hypothetical protein